MKEFSHELNEPKWRWILILGAAGFVAGFFGPIALVPEANQGPLVGIFISGPGGALLGFALYLISKICQIPAHRQWQMLYAFSSALVLITLFYVLPRPALRGHLIEVQIQNCRAPTAITDELLKDWQDRIAKVTWASPRPGWEKDLRESLEKDQGVILEVNLLRKNEIRIHKKPWNNGKIWVLGWKDQNETKSYYSSVGPCTNFHEGDKLKYYLPYDVSVQAPKDWPPLKDFINFQSLQPVPPELRSF